MENISKAIYLKNQLDNLRPIDKIQEERIMQKFRLDWNYHSNHLEGNSLTYGETKALILFGITAQGKPLQDHFEITGHNEAINWVIDVVKGDYPLNENFIRELHTLLLKQSYEVDAITPDGKPTKKRINVGSYKTSPNHVKTKTGEIFYFATPEETPSKMTDLINWYREKSEQKEVNPIFLAAEFHYKFIRIHPFDDGNGRTARILMNFILMKFDFPPVIIKTEDKANYFAVLQLADAGNIEAFVEYIAQNLIRSLEIMIAGANGEDIEEEDDLDKEIALLEQRLSKTKIKYSYNKAEKLKELFNFSIINFIEKFKLKMLKFGKLYSDVNFDIELDNMGLVKNNPLIDYFKKVDVYLIENVLDVKILFIGLKREELKGLSYLSEISIRFEEKFYYFNMSNGRIIQLSYSDVLDEKTINKIIQIEVKRHKEFIEQKIAEKENK
ncbi:Fic family protein [Flavobacterium flevense]|uniref:Fido domain-containing protein n=1 Tax=Flavobacterium flevense TaxID=983 RepID=A0A4Y4B3B6_9FLAO|nr:Fic family protein [Flavobacterium flevense]GEC73163.1 hypothetical protein FFL01_27020 [Flavobacterium flevense]SHL48052.1 Fic family protein [Flavobacterium flevense]